MANLFDAEMTGLDGSGVVADEDPVEPGVDDMKPPTSAPRSEGAFEDDELDGVEAIILIRMVYVWERRRASSEFKLG